MCFPINDKRFIFTEEAREEAAEMYGETASISVLGIADTNRDFVMYGCVGVNGKGETILCEPFFRTYSDMIQEV
jgi:hypothetical protein